MLDNKAMRFAGDQITSGASQGETQLAFNPLNMVKFQFIKDAAGERPFGAGTKMTPEQEYDIYDSPTLGPRDPDTIRAPRDEQFMDIMKSGFV